MSLYGVDTWTSVSYCSVVLGPSPAAQDGVISFADSRVEKKDEEGKAQTAHGNFLLKKGTKICLNTPIYTLVPKI